MQIRNQTRKNNLNYLIDPTFTKVNRIFVLSFEIEDHRTAFSKYYSRNAEIKDFNVLINRKSLFDTLIKVKEGTYEKIIEMGRFKQFLEIIRNAFD